MVYRIGVDVGQRSLGLAAVEFDDDGFPLRILAAPSHIHDGGMDPDTSKTPQSRLATAGAARRTRRLIRNRRRRLQALDEVLRAHRLPVPEKEIPQTHQAWDARSRLVSELVADEGERSELLSLAIRHLARHRGWRNPWWSYRRLAEVTTPSEALTRTMLAARTKHPDLDGDVQTLGQLVSGVARTGAPIRPTKRSEDHPLGRVMADQVRQEDSLAELRMMLAKQRISPVASEAICEAVFFQNKPRIPADRIGKCDLQPTQLRAPLATLEFQEFRIRSAVANLRIGKEKRALTADEHDRAIDLLVGWRDEARPRWRDVADLLGVGARDLVDSSIDGSAGSVAPHDRTSEKLELEFKVKSSVGAWWLKANESERADLIDALCDLSGDEIASSAVTELLEDEDLIEPLMKVGDKLETGRAAYSRDTLHQLNEVMREQRCDLHVARKVAFDVDDNWKPVPPSLDDPIEHPTVARVNVLLRRFLHTAIAKWGMPEAIVVEHVREAFMGPAALAELQREITSNTKRRAQTAELLKTQGVENPNRSSIRRNECVERQASVCLYCGTTIGLLTCELDHIVPRSGGGSSRRDNLVAVCRSCNAAKGREPLAVFAARAGNPQISVAKAQERVRGWERSGLTLKSFRRLQSEVRERLELTEDDEIDERSLESTAYAAREMRARVQAFLDDQAARMNVPAGTVVVLPGIATSEARKAGGIDDQMRLRSFTRKSRLDRRHHAIDAAILTTLSLGVAKTLKERANMHRDNQYVGKTPEWKDWRGRHPGDQSSFGEWQKRVKVLADLLHEAVENDAIPVVRPLRLAPRVGSVHADTVERLAQKSIGDPFTQGEILRIVDRGLFMKLADLANGGDLDPDSERSDLVKWAPSRPVALFPSNAAFLPVRNGAVAIGGSIRWARVFAWPTKHGFGYGMIRMYAGEFAKLGFLRPQVDIFTAPLPESSMAIRTANRVLAQRIRGGAAKQIGWIAVDDELEIEPTHFTGDDSKMSLFLSALPESRWIVTGFFDSSKVSLAPSYLASEGIDDATPEAVASILRANRVRLAINQVLGSEGCTVIRRTITGAPRWTGTGLPVSWSVREAAERIFST